MTVVPMRGWVPDPAHDFGARLALVRQNQGWNRKQAAEACGIGPATWAGWELRGIQPRGFAEDCAKIAAASGVDYFWLMTGYVPGQRDGREVTRDYRGWPSAVVLPFLRRETPAADQLALTA